MSSDVITVLEDLQRTIKEGKTGEAIVALEDLRGAYEEQTAEERRRMERAKTLARETAGDEPDALRTYLDEMLAVRLNRAGALIALRMSLIYPDQTDEDPVALVEALEQREQTVLEAAEAVSDDLEGVSLPAFPAVVGVHPPEGAVGKGATVDVTAAILNVGDEPATGLSSGVQLSDGLELVDSTEVSQRLTPGESTEVIATVRAESAGDRTITVEVSGDSDREGVETGQLEVLTKGGFVDRAQRHLDQLRTRIEESSPPSGGTQRKLMAKLDAASEKLADAEHHVERSEPKRANNALRTASNQLGAFINAVEGDGAGNGRAKMSESSRRALVESASDTIDLLSGTRTAEI